MTTKKGTFWFWADWAADEAVRRLDNSYALAMTQLSLDRTPDGVIRKCDTCKRQFKGEGWMDYCAECHAENERTSPLRKRAACLTCNNTFEFGKIRSGPRGWQCPYCKSGDITTAEGIRELPAYHGEIPERKQ